MRASSCSPLERMLLTQRVCLSLRPSVDGQHLAEAEDRVQRRAQLVAHGGQEIALESVGFVQRQVGLGQLVDLAVEVGVDLAQAVLHVDEVAQHAVEGVAEVLELVAGLDLAADVQFAGGDGVADLLEVLDRLDDHVAHDEVTAGHDEQGRHQGGGDQHRAVDVDAVHDGVDGLLRHLDLDQGDEVLGLHLGQVRVGAALQLAVAFEAGVAGPDGAVIQIGAVGQELLLVLQLVVVGQEVLEAL